MRHSTLRQLALTTTILWVGSVAKSAYADQPIRTRWSENFAAQHDRGVTLSGSAGPAFVSAGITSPRNAGAASLEFVGGYLTRQNLSLGASVWGHKGAQRNALFVGPNASLWLSPEVLFSASAGAGRAMEEDWDGLALATTLSISRLWWVGEETMLGVSTYGGGFGVDLDGDGYEPMGVMGGIRITFTWH